MPFLSPAKLLVILVVALVVLGPDKLPKVAKQVGGLWGDFRKFREKLESEVRGNFPDLPSTHTITQAVRSPLSFLDNLAETERPGNEPTSGGPDRSGAPEVAGDALVSSSGMNRPTGTVHSYAAPPSIPTQPTAESKGRGHQVRGQGDSGDDPGMN